MGEDLTSHAAINAARQCLTNRQLDGNRLACVEERGNQRPRSRGIRQADQSNRHDAILHTVTRTGDSNRLGQERRHSIR